MTLRALLAIAVAFAAATVGSHALAADPALPAAPVVTLSAAATASVVNDRMHAWLRAEADNPDPVRAAADVNAKMARALARAKAVAGVDVATSGYSSYQITDKNQPARWRVAQTLTLQGADFAAIAALVTRLQADDALLLTGMNFSVSPDSRRKAEDALTQQAIKSWQARAQNAARGFGYDNWRAGKVTIQTGDYAPPPRPMYRAAAAPMAAGAPPVSVEGGDTDVTVTVVGEAVLESQRPGSR
ncbi:MAG: SIMPL domain-containing protein [Betaproteobacteria bacterium]|nr:SIMPL domain-containing protein [Betaproteobacteria bacterium]MCC7216336.1 SIMPL domain-containing protein [Burkholderiales bacterium]